MTAEERDRFLAGQRVCRVATVSVGGAPHVQPLWYVWHDESLWFYSIIRSQRWRDLERDPRVAAVVDAGGEYENLRGIEMAGRVEGVGEVPRKGDFNPELETPERLFVERYHGGIGPFPHDGRHAWLRLRPERQYSWDFRKL